MIIKKIKESNKDKKFWIDPDVFDEIIAFAESAYRQFKTEIGGQLVVREDKDGDFILEDPVILKQKVSSTNCELDEAALAVHYSKMAGKHGDNIRHCWWHSHHTMGAFWSGTDNATILANKSHDFTVSLVVNLKQEYKLRVQFFYPFEHEENVTLNFLEDIDEVRDAAIDTEVKELCTKSAVTVTKYDPKTKTYANGNQTGLWTKQDQTEVDDYNMYGYGVNAYGDGYGYRRNTSVDMDKIPADKVKPVNDLIEEIQDKLIDDNCTYEQYLQMRTTVNDSIKGYNLKMKLMNKEELEALVYHYWPEDFLENIQGRDTVVHK